MLIVFICCFRRIRDKYEGEISELERTERLTTQKYNETKVGASLSKLVVPMYVRPKTK